MAHRNTAASYLIKIWRWIRVPGIPEALANTRSDSIRMRENRAQSDVS